MPKTPLRNIRIDDELWTPALVKAEREGSTLSQVIRDLLTQWTNTITYHPGDPPPNCQHYHIDNDTWRCAKCSERMLSVTVEAETILSAPNAAPCRDPRHLAAIKAGEAGEDFQCSHPYVPDLIRQREVVIGYTYTYECARCQNSGNLMTLDGIIWDCGHSHIGRTDR